MSTDKLQAIHDTVAEILSEPPSSPHSYFDDEPHDPAPGGEQVATASDYLQRATQLPTGTFGKGTSGQPGISPNETRKEQSVRDPENESPGMAREGLAEKIRDPSAADVARQQLFKQSSKAASYPSDRRTSSSSTLRPAASRSPRSFRTWALRGFAGVVLAAGVGAGAFSWLGSARDAARTVPSQPAAAALPTGVSPELTSLLQSISGDLASARKEIEQLKAGRELIARENANLTEQLKASQEQLTRSVARLSEQIKASQEQVARDNANAAEQIKGIQDQLARVVLQAAEQNAPPKIAATVPRRPLPPPRPAAPAGGKPMPIVSSAPAAAQPKPEKPKLSSTSPPPPVR